MDSKKDVYIQNEKYLGKLTIKEIKEIVKENEYNLVVPKTNGYSHDWEEAIEFKEEHILNIHNVYLTKKPLGRIMGSSIVSFS